MVLKYHALVLIRSHRCAIAATVKSATPRAPRTREGVYLGFLVRLEMCMGCLDGGKGIPVDDNPGIVWTHWVGEVGIDVADDHLDGGVGIGYWMPLIELMEVLPMESYGEVVRPAW